VRGPSPAQSRLPVMSMTPSPLICLRPTGTPSPNPSHPCHPSHPTHPSQRKPTLPRSLGHHPTCTASTLCSSCRRSAAHCSRRSRRTPCCVRRAASSSTVVPSRACAWTKTYVRVWFGSLWQTHLCDRSSSYHTCGAMGGGNAEHHANTYCGGTDRARAYRQANCEVACCCPAHSS
jgi:hypothetical protein